MKNSSIVSLALGSVFAAAAFSPLAQAGENPFAAKPMASGYQLAQADMPADAMGKKADGSCGAGKTLSEKKKDGKCAASKRTKHHSTKKADGSCGATKAAPAMMPAEGMGMDKNMDKNMGVDKKADGKCGEAKCGADKR